MTDGRTAACVLVFAGLDPSGGAGIQADIQAITAAGAHALPIVTALTVQDNQHVQAVHPVEAAVLREQAKALVDRPIRIDAVKIGIVGSAANARAIAQVIVGLRATNPQLPVVLDPVLASGHGDALARGNAVLALQPLRALATLITPNLPEAAALCGCTDLEGQAAFLLQDTPHALVKGGHGEGSTVVNVSFSHAGKRSREWPRLPGGFHGSGCTLASAIAARLALGMEMEAALDEAQAWTQRSLERAYAIADGQLIPRRLND